MSAFLVKGPAVEPWYACCASCNWISHRHLKGEAEQARQHHDRDVHGINTPAPSARSWVDAREDIEDLGIEGGLAAGEGGRPGGAAGGVAAAQVGAGVSRPPG